MARMSLGMGVVVEIPEDKVHLLEGRSVDWPTLFALKYGIMTAEQLIEQIEQEIRKEKWSFEATKEDAMKAWEKMRKQQKEISECEDACHNQEIKGYLYRAIADIARKCGVSQSEVWAEVEYWSRDKA